MERLIRCTTILAGLIWAPAAMATTHTLTPNPSSAQAAFHAYRLGVLPTGGTLVVDSADPALCLVEITA